jgi:PAS domain S-box-containing protein
VDDPGAQIGMAEAPAAMAERERLLEAIAEGRPLDECLSAVTAAIGRLVPGSRAGILVPDRARGVFERTVAADIPRTFGDGTRGSRIEEFAIGSCGTAVWSGEPVASTDIASDERWSPEWRALCLAHGFRAVHSQPLIGPDGRALASLAIFLPEPRALDAAERAIAVFGARIGALALERDRQAAALRASEERYRLATQAFQGAVYECDADTREVFRSDSFSELVGLRPDEMSPDWAGWHDRVHADDLPRVLAALASVYDGDADRVEVEYRVRHRDGQWVHVWQRGLALRDASGRLLRVVGSIVDTTAREIALGRQHRADDTLRRLVEESPFGTYVVDSGFRVVLASATARATFGHANPVVGRNLTEALRGIWPEPFASEAIARFRHTLATGERYATAETRERRADRDVEEAYDWRLDRVILPDGRYGVVCHFYELTALRRAEAALAELNAELQRRVADALAERDSAWRNARDMIVVVDMQGVFLTTNPAASEIIGWQPEELIGRPVFDFIHPDDVEASLGALAHARSEALPIFENRYRHKDGSWRTISWVAAPEGERIYAYGRDVTAERTQAVELAEAQARLAQAQRMEALGQLAGGIAHDFNNVLQAVQGGARLIGARHADPAQVRRLAGMVAEAAERGAAITRRLLAFARHADLRAEPVDAAALLGDMQEILKHTLGTGIEVQVTVPQGLPPLLADRRQLETVLINLAANARDALLGHGTIALSALVESIPAAATDGPDDAARPGLKPGQYVLLSIADSGTGMDAATLARAAEPFFTTKREGKGTGLGLAMARGFAEQSGGALAIASAPGQGTTVRLWFPVAQAVPLSHATEVAAAEPGLAGRATVLLVDDELLVREITAEGLETAGYAVLSAGSGTEALDLLRTRLKVDMLITDLSMPTMDGLAVIREAQALRPGLPAILLTGFATEATRVALGSAIDGSFTLLRKPMAAGPLAARIAAMVQASAPAT